MRGRFRDQGGLFSYISPETRVPALHPLREIRELVRAVLKDLGPSFGKLYASEGRPSIPDKARVFQQTARALPAADVAESDLPAWKKLVRSAGVQGAHTWPLWRKIYR